MYVHNTHTTLQIWSAFSFWYSYVIQFSNHRLLSQKLFQKLHKIPCVDDKNITPTHVIATTAMRGWVGYHKTLQTIQRTRNARALFVNSIPHTSTDRVPAQQLNTYDRTLFLKSFAKCSYFLRSTYASVTLIFEILCLLAVHYNRKPHSKRRKKVRLAAVLH